MVTAPRVSVVVPVWNVAPWLDECLRSVERQTFGTQHLELIAVDDGSTDGSGEQLDAFAADRAWVRVVHQENSGGPGRPRNTGLDMARGEYVFFLDADDYLGDEALERLVTMADRNTSDIVLGRMVGVGGRVSSGRTGAFKTDRDRVPAERVSRSGNVLKLFRRSMLERVGLRFQPGLAGGEDGDFMARAYLEAETISVVASYDCYYARRRPGSQTTRTDRRDDLVDVIRRLEANRIEIAVARREAGTRRDLLLVKPLHKMASKFWNAWPKRTPDERDAAFEAGSEVARRWYGPGVERFLRQPARLALHCLAMGRQDLLEDVVNAKAQAYDDPIVEGDRVYARYPHFRDEAGLPDHDFEITSELKHHLVLRRAAVAGGRLELEGEAFIRLLGGTTTIEVRRGRFGRTQPLPTTVVPTPGLRDNAVRYPQAGFHASVDVATLGKGTWSVRAVSERGAVQRIAPVRVPAGRGKNPIDRTAKGEGAVLRLGPGRSLRVLVGRQSPSAADRLAHVAAATIARARRLGGRVRRRLRRSSGPAAGTKRGPGGSKRRRGSGSAG